jgi:type II secretory pathway component PulF
MFINQYFIIISYAISILLGIAILVFCRFLSQPQTIALKKTLLIISGLLIIGGTIGYILLLIVFAEFAIVVLTVVLTIILVTGAFLLARETILALLQPYIHSQQNALLWSLAIAVENDVSLVSTIVAFAQGSKWILRSKLMRLASLINSGVPLIQALQRTPGVLPKNALPLIQIGDASGALGKALRQAASSRDSLQPTWDILSEKLTYIVTVIIFGLGILTFLMLKIIPSFEKIFKDYNIDLPPVTIFLISTSHFLLNYFPIFILFCFLLLGLVLYIRLARYTRFQLYFPAFTALMPRHTANILDNLALATENDQILGKSLIILAYSYPQFRIKQKLSAVKNDISSGVNWCDSLYDNRLIKQSDHAVLKAAQRVGNLPWAMREMADSNRRRLAFRLNTLIQLAYPPVILGLGLIIMFIVVALFYPNVVLISRLAGL